MLLTFADYQRLAGNRPSIVDLLAEPPGVEDVDFHTPIAPDTARPADFD